MRISKLHQVALGTRNRDEAARFCAEVPGARFTGRFDPLALASQCLPR